MKEVQKSYDRTCQVCGARWLGTSSQCPNADCPGVGKSDGREFTKKIVDDNDLFKRVR